MDQVVTQLPRRPHQDFGLPEGAQVVEMLVDGGWLLAGVCEDGQVEALLGVGFTGQQEQAGGFDPRTEVEDVVLLHPLSRSAARYFRRYFSPRSGADARSARRLARLPQWSKYQSVQSFPGRGNR